MRRFPLSIKTWKATFKQPGVDDSMTVDKASDWMHRFLPMLRYASPNLELGSLSQPGDKTWLCRPLIGSPPEVQLNLPQNATILGPAQIVWKSKSSGLVSLLLFVKTAFVLASTT